MKQLLIAIRNNMPKNVHKADCVADKRWTRLKDTSENKMKKCKMCGFENIGTKEHKVTYKSYCANCGSILWY